MGIKEYLWGVNKKQTQVVLISVLFVILMWGYYAFISPSLIISGKKDDLKDITEVKLVNSEHEYKGKISEKGDQKIIEIKKGYNDKAQYQLIIKEGDKQQIINEPLNINDPMYLTFDLGTYTGLARNEQGVYIPYISKNFVDDKYIITSVLLITSLNILILLVDWIRVTALYNKNKIIIQAEVLNFKRIKKLKITDSYLHTTKSFGFNQLRMLDKDTKNPDNRILTLDSRASSRKHNFTFILTDLEGIRYYYLISIPVGVPVVRLTINTMRNNIAYHSQKDVLAQVVYPYKIQEQRK